MVLFAFNLKSWAPPPAPPANLSCSQRSGHLRVTFTTASRGNDPIYPATYLQLSCKIDCSTPTEVFLEDTYVSRDVKTIQPATSEQVKAQSNAPVDDSGPLYEITLPISAIPKMKLGTGMDPTMSITLYAWQGPKLLGSWELGQLKGDGYFQEERAPF